MPHRIEAHIATASQVTFTRPQEVEDVQTAIASRSLEAVKEAFSKWIERDVTDRCDIGRFVVCLHEAIKLNDASILSYLISENIPFDNYHIRHAVDLKSTSLLQVFLHNGWNINEPVSSSTPPVLCEAIMDVNLTKWFLERGADPNAECDFGFTPLSIAVARAPLSTIELLFQSGGVAQRGQLLHYAVIRTEPDHIDVLELLFSRGVVGINDLLHQDRENVFEMMKAIGLGTPLHTAAEEGPTDTVKCLLDHKADPSLANSRGDLAIDLARNRERFDVVELLSAASGSE